MDFGWHPTADGTKARLTWREDGALVLFYAGSNVTEVLVPRLAEAEARRFAEGLGAAPTVATIKELVDKWYPF